MNRHEQNAGANPPQEFRPEDIIVPENINGGVIGVGVQEMEDELTELQIHIENEEWEEALVRVRMHPGEIMPTRSQGGMGRGLTALHLACENADCPIPLMRAILARRPEVAAMVDRDGNTPLHIACAGPFAYDHFAICLLLIAYPQATLMQDFLELSTPLHLLLVLGGDVNLVCLRLILDVAYSTVAGLPRSYVPMQDFCGSDLSSALLHAANYPPIVIQTVREVAIENMFTFPQFLQSFIQLPAPTTLDVRPGLVEGQSRLTILQENKQQTPLHSACARGLKSEVIRLLTNEARYPGAHDAARMKDRKDRDPLFYAACYGIPLDAIKLLYDLNPAAAHHFESYRILPLHVTYITPAHTDEERKLEIKREREDLAAPIEDYFVLQTAVPLWRRYEIFLRLTYHRSYEDPPPDCSHWRVVHAVGSVPSPQHFVRSAIKLHPWQLRERDEEGYLPLHRAAKCERPEGIDEGQYWLPKGINKKALYKRCHPENRSEDNTVSIFIHAYPEAARVLDNDLRLPLHLAIQTDKQWDEGVRSIVNAAPLALATRDPDNHLYPFMMAAMCDNLNLTLELLLSNPMMVQSGLDVYDTSRTPSLHSEDDNPAKKTKYTGNGVPSCNSSLSFSEK